MRHDRRTCMLVTAVAALPLSALLGGCGGPARHAASLRAADSPAAVTPSAEDPKQYALEHPSFSPDPTPPAVASPLPTSCPETGSPTYEAPHDVGELDNPYLRPEAPITATTITDQSNQYIVLAGLGRDAPESEPATALPTRGLVVVYRGALNPCAAPPPPLSATGLPVPGAHGDPTITSTDGDNVTITNADGTSAVLNLLSLVISTPR